MAGLLAQPGDLSWDSLCPRPAPDVCPTPTPALCSLPGGKRTQGRCLLSLDSKGPQGDTGTEICRRKDILPARAVPQGQRLPQIVEREPPVPGVIQELEATGEFSGWAQGPPSILIAKAFPCFEILSVSDPLS